jgi:hypothetical protein
MGDQCVKILDNGERCGAYAVGDGIYCLNHTDDPRYKDAKERRHIMGGRYRGASAMRPKVDDGISWEDIEIKTPMDVSTVLERATNAALRGEITTQRASSIAQLCNSMLKSLEVGSMAKEIEELKKMIGGKE